MQRERSQAIRDFIIENVTEQPGEITRVTAAKFGITRQAALRHIQNLVEEGLLEAMGTTRNRVYKLKPIVQEHFQFPLAPELEEDVVWRNYIANLVVSLPKNVFDICHYGFSEIFNNVLDHSEGNRVTLSVLLTAKSVEMWVIDDGVGIFNKIKDQLGLEDHRHAILELAKGKLTTDPEHHTGEGIFFTSRMFDRFSILSSHLFFDHQEPGDDWLIEHSPDGDTGTTVRMRISPQCQRITREVFERFAAEEHNYGFTRTHVPVNLLQYGEENLVSRSQARRLLARFERFKEVLLDFEGVQMIGQAFADEIFRVFHQEQPGIKLVWVRANADVERVIRAVLMT